MKSLDAADRALVRGQVALVQGRTAQAIHLLKESIELREDRSGTPAMSATVSIARAFRLSGDLPQAVHTLEEASRNRFASCLWPTANAHLWVQMRSELGELYRKVGRDGDAVNLEAKLLKTLALADEEHPVKARVRGDASRGFTLKPVSE